MRDVASVTLRQIRKQFSTTWLMQRLCGNWVRFLMFRKLGLSLLDRTFVWIEQGKYSRHRSRRHSRAVLDELFGLCLMWPLFRTSFGAPHVPQGLLL